MRSIEEERGEEVSWCVQSEEGSGGERARADVHSSSIQLCICFALLN